MSVLGIGSRAALTTQSLLEMRRQLDDLQRQLGTGRKASDYAGLGLDRGLTVSLRSQLSMIGGYNDVITNVKVRTELSQVTLDRVADIGRDIKHAAYQPSSVGAGGPAMLQVNALSALGEMLGILNTRAGDRYLFSGRATDQPSVETVEHILNGDGARAGLNQIISERRQADLGATGLGRLDITAPTTTSVALAEDAVGSPFGFKIDAVTSALANVTVTGPGGAPVTVEVDFAGSPNPGETIQFRFTLPDGTTESVTLTATASAPPGLNEFTIDAVPDTTAANFQAALTAALTKAADTSLTAASAMAAAENFFAIDDANPPQRVAGPPPFTGATGFVAGTNADTVFWYTGDAATDSARSTAVARIDASISVAYGVRANEEAIRRTVQNVAVLAAMSFSPNDPNANARSMALNQRAGTALDGPAGAQRIEMIQTELASAQAALGAAAGRHQQTSSMLSQMLDRTEGVPIDQVGAEILALQTRLQASLQTTALLYQTSLVRFL